MTFQERLQQAFAEEAERRASVGEPRLTKTDLWKAADASSAAATHWFNGANGMDLATCVKVAPILRVNAQWLYDGSGSKQRVSGPSATPERAGEPWPFRSIPEEQVRALDPIRLAKLEGALLMALSQMSLGTQLASSGQHGLPRRGELSSAVEAVDDPFPMAPVVDPAPWEPGGKTTRQMERDVLTQQRPISLAKDVIANVAPGEPHAANDKFEKVAELADVRLAAGDGIENHSEEQTGVVQFRKSFLRSVGADPKTARVVYAKGDSMEPVIRDGAALLVVPNENLTLRDIAAGGVYAINYDGKMLVKTLTEDPRTKRWVARSFNSAYPDIMLDDSVRVRVLGAVVWCGTRLT